MEQDEIHKNIEKKLQELAKNGRLTCAEAHQLAVTEGATLMSIGKLVEQAGIKICDCQLGCFGKHKGS